jgi:LPXTG-site transpeptidase (sortase) family protein
VPSHRKPPSRRSTLYTVVLIAVVVFAVIIGFGGSPKKSAPTAESETSSPTPTVSTSSTRPPLSASPTKKPKAKPTSKATKKPTAKATKRPKATPSAKKSTKKTTKTKTPAPKPSASSTGLGTSDASLKSLQARAQARPVEVRIPALSVDAQVISRGVDDKGALEVPGNVTQAAWYRSGATPGSGGTAIIAAHVDFGGKKGLFNGLQNLKKGDVIYVTDFARHVRRFTVVVGKLAPKSDPSTVQSLAAASSKPGQTWLALITCGGALNAAKHSYYDNYVLLAKG